MDKNFLYGIIVLLSITDAFIYIQKTNPNILDNFLPWSQNESWQNKDPDWGVKPNLNKKDENKEEKKEDLNEINPKEKEQNKEGNKGEKKRRMRFFNGCFS